MNVSQQRPIATLDLSGVEGSWTETLVSTIHWIDNSFGTHEWTTRQVALVSLISLGLIKALTQEKYGVKWYIVWFAIVSGYLSLICVCLNVFAATELTGTSEPLRSILCQGPLTSLHRHVPAMTVGFGVFDLIEGYTHGTVDFVSVPCLICWCIQNHNYPACLSLQANDVFSSRFYMGLPP